MEIDFSLLNNLKNDALKRPTSEGNDNMRINTPKLEKSQPQGKYEGESRKTQSLCRNLQTL